MRALAVLVGVVAVAAIAVALRSTAVTDAVAAGTEWARSSGTVGVVVFVAAYVIATVLLIPGSVLTIAAGFTYGLGWGAVLVAPTAIVSATVAFLVGRTLAREGVTRRYGRDRRFQAIDTAIGQRGAIIVALLRLSPVFPFVVLNYVLSLSKVSTRTYVVASALGMLPGTILFVYLGSLAGTAAEAAHGGAGPSTARIALLAAGLVATIAVMVIVARVARRELARTRAVSTPEVP